MAILVSANDVERGRLRTRIVSVPKTQLGLADMRGYDWSAARHDDRVRPTYHEDHIVGVDFCSSRADQGFRMRGAVFEECIFDKSVWCVAAFSKCKFIKCSFNDCHLHNCSLGDKFYDCAFKSLSAMGEHFSFGWGSEYRRCDFESVELHNIGHMVGVRFEDCKISGTLTNGVFHGRRYALRERFSSLPDLLFSTHYRPVKFIRCDLSGLTTKDFVFERDVVFKDSAIDQHLLSM